MNIDLLIDEIKDMVNEDTERIMKDNEEYLMIGSGDVRPMFKISELEKADIDERDFVDRFVKTNIDGKGAGVDMMVEKINNFDEVKENMKICVCSHELDDSVVSEDFLDLKAYVRIIFKDYGVTVTKKLLEMWEITQEELFNSAKEIATYNVINLDEMFGQDGNTGMYVITNNDAMYGAGAITDLATLDRASDMVDDDLVILPSSIHEIIVLPLSKYDDSLKEMVETINANVVSDEDVLSDNIYAYSREDKELRIIG